MDTQPSGAVPLSLVERIEGALRESGGDPNAPGTQLNAAEACLEMALAKGGQRSAALDLLAADALLTSACGAAVRPGSTSVEALAAEAALRLARHLTPEVDR